jgi:AcrR family transcriptional regulator
MSFPHATLSVKLTEAYDNGIMLTMSTLKKSASEFHHGDLQAALVMAGLRHVEKHGLNSLGLRQLALVTGVSPTAVYRHFVDLEHLKASVAKASREVLGTMMLDAMESASKAKGAKAANERFRAMGSAYIDFGLKKPNLFEIAFICFDAPRLEEDSPNPWELLMSSLTELNELGCISDKNFKTAPMIAWSMVHGFAALAAQGVTGTAQETQASKNDILAAVKKALDIKVI